MKVEKLILDERDNIHAVAEIPAKTQKIFDSVTQFKGHTMFEINCTTGKIIPAVYEEITASITGEVKKKILTKENCLYISCLNKKSASKKFLKWLMQKRAQQKQNSPKD